MFDFMGFTKFIQNPMEFCMNKIGIPNGAINSIDQIPQYLMNQGKLTQQQYNDIIKEANQLQKNPQFLQFLNRFNSPH